MSAITPIEIGSTANINDSDSDIFTAAASGGDTILNDDRSLLVIRNTGEASRTVTIAVQNATQKSEGSGTITFSDMTITIDATANEYEARVKVPRIPYNNGSGAISLTYLSEADLEIAMFTLSKF